MQNALSNIPNKINGGEARRSKDEDFEKLQKLGAGSFGVVYMVRRKQDKKQYVMKVVETRKMSSNQKRESVLEATIMSKVHC
jgi:serine/threonine protein kinase